MNGTQVPDSLIYVFQTNVWHVQIYQEVVAVKNKAVWFTILACIQYSYIISITYNNCDLFLSFGGQNLCIENVWPGSLESEYGSQLQSLLLNCTYQAYTANNIKQTADWIGRIELEFCEALGSSQQVFQQRGNLPSSIYLPHFDPV